MNLQEKEAAVADLRARFSESSSAFLVDFKGCSCADLTGLRNDLRPAGAEFAIVKNTLAKRAVAETDVAELDGQFIGPTAVIWSKTDPVMPAKLLTKFAKDQETFVVKAGVVDGQVVNESEIDSLAKLPSKEELIAKLLALLNAPATRLLQTMNAPASELVRLLEAWRAEIEKKDS